MAQAGPDEEPSPPTTETSSSALDRTFKISIGLKGIDGLLEIIGGIILLFVAPVTLQQWARSLTAHELAQDPNDFIARHLLHSASQLSHSTTLFGAIYLLSHGIAKGRRSSSHSSANNCGPTHG